MKKNIIISGGGTGGHISPAISIAKEMEKYNYQIIYVGNSNSMEEKIALENNLIFKEINVQKLYRKLTLKHLFFPYKLLLSIYKSIKIIVDYGVFGFIGTGGFVSGPVGYAAHLMNIPIFLLEQNSFPGLTTRKLAKYSEKIFLGNKGAKKFLPQDKVIYTGNPINIEPSDKSEEEIFNYLNLDEKNKTILIIGGSQGSKRINDIIEKNINILLEKNFNIIWQVGKNNKNLIDKYSHLKNLYIFDFSYKINEFYKISDLLIARAGALTLTEAEYFRIPSILIPLPSAAGNHQYYNALEMQKKGISKIIEEKYLSSDILLQTINSMMQNLGKYTFNHILNSKELIAHEIYSSLSGTI